MRIKNLFTVPTGQKITERHLRRVLISSICSILLCMSCLVGTTWAWFTVSIENTGNVIQIGSPEITVTDTVDDSETELTSGTTLTAGTHTIKINHANEADDLQKKSTLYVTLTIQSGEDTITAYATLNQDNQYGTELTIVAEKDWILRWEVSWFAPVNAIELIDGTITLTAGDPAEETTAPAETTTEPTETTTAPTEATTAPTETTVPTETTAPTEATTAPTESTPVPTESTPAPTESTPVSTEATTAPTETTPAPTETTPAPTETTPAPTETTPAPTEAATESTAASNNSTEIVETTGSEQI